jgi:hypothetical protein
MPLESRLPVSIMIYSFDKGSGFEGLFIDQGT